MEVRYYKSYKPSLGSDIPFPHTQVQPVARDLRGLPPRHGYALKLFYSVLMAHFPAGIFI